MDSNNNKLPITKVTFTRWVAWVWLLFYVWSDHAQSALAPTVTFLAFMVEAHAMAFAVAVIKYDQLVAILERMSETQKVHGSAILTLQHGHTLKTKLEEFEKD